MTTRGLVVALTTKLLGRFCCNGASPFFFSEKCDTKLVQKTTHVRAPEISTMADGRAVPFQIKRDPRRTMPSYGRTMGRTPETALLGAGGRLPKAPRRRRLY